MPAPETTVAASDLEVLREAVLEAGELALGYFERRVDGWTKSDGSPVSEADLATDRLLRSRLTAARPDHGWLSEESADHFAGRDRPRAFVVDPIDGTSAFLAGSAAWCVGVAILDRGRPVAAAVNAPARGELWLAGAGAGATLNGRPIVASRRDRLEGARVIANKNTFKAARWREPWPPMELASATSLILRLCLVASGEYDAAVAIGHKHDWDLAPGDLIVHEAGGRVGDLSGRPLIYNRETTRQHGLAASGPALFPALVTRTASLIG